MLQCRKCIELPSGFLPWSPRKKGEKYLCSPLAFTLMQLLRSEELALYVIFSSGKQNEFIRTIFFFRFSTAFILMQYFLLHLPESSIAHLMPYASRTALALGRK